jgi:hypothetical protein
MYTVFYPLKKADAHGNFIYEKEEIEDAASYFSEFGQKKLTLLHGGKTIDAAITNQFWIVKAGDPIFKEERHIGALVGGTKFYNKEVYEEFKAGKYETSIEGEAEEVPATQEEINNIAKSHSIIEDLKEFIKNLFAKSQNNNYIKEDDEVILHDESVTKGIIMSPEEVKALIMAMKAEIMAELKPEKPEVEIEAGKPAETMPAIDPEKEELKKALELKTAEAEKLKADLEKQVKKSVQVKEENEPEKEVKKQFSMFN